MKNETKARIFAPYIDVVEIFRSDNNISLGKLTHYDLHKLLCGGGFNFYANLTSLKDISDEHMRLILSVHPSSKNIKDLKYHEGCIVFKQKTSYSYLDTKINVQASSIAVSLLRQLGYATDYMVIEDGKVITYSVDELVKEGIYKLK